MIVACMNRKGGVGKSTTSLALATLASRDGKQTILYDGDNTTSSSYEWARDAKDNNDPLPFPVEPFFAMMAKETKAEYGENPDKWAFIDCPPGNDSFNDAVADIADLVIIPTTDDVMVRNKAYPLAQTLAKRMDIADHPFTYSILITKAVRSTTDNRPLRVNLREMEEELKALDLSYFDTQIPSRTEIGNFFGNSFGDDLYGYEGVWAEIKEVLL